MKRKLIEMIQKEFPQYSNEQVEEIAESLYQLSIIAQKIVSNEP